MNAATPKAHPGPNQVGHSQNRDAASDAPGHGAGGPATSRIIIGYGFWIFLLSDIILFSAFFAAYAVLSGATAHGPEPKQIFDLKRVALETGCLLLSSFTCGMASLAVKRENQLWSQLTLLVTGLLGAAFLSLEAQEFLELAAHGAGPTQSAFLSAFFTLVGCHGLHITLGLLWLGTMMAQIFAKGFRPEIHSRFLCFSLFWHTLDIVWVGIFSLVYLLGAL